MLTERKFFESRETAREGNKQGIKKSCTKVRLVYVCYYIAAGAVVRKGNAKSELNIGTLHILHICSQGVYNDKNVFILCRRIHSFVCGIFILCEEN